ncbi:MAG: dihydroorotase family protein, partial [Candidatus Bathyarchaeia archaeon]
RDSLVKVLKAVKETGLRLSVHAEDSNTVNTLINRLKREGRSDPMAHVESRPIHVEEEAIARLIGLARGVGTPIHIAHMSTRGGVQLVRDAKASGQALTAETCPHHLLLTSEAMEEYGPYAKINPPLRGGEDVEELWRAVNNGTIDIVASDHAPYTQEEKDVGWKDIWRAPSGTPQIEVMLPLLLTEVKRGRISLERLVEVTSEAVARTFGIFPMKGAIQVGSDADLVIVDLEAEGEILVDRLYTKARNITIYRGWRVRGMSTATIVRGEVVMEGGEVVGEPGHGRFISPIKTLGDDV